MRYSEYKWFYVNQIKRFNNSVGAKKKKIELSNSEKPFFFVILWFYNNEIQNILLEEVKRFQYLIVFGRCIENFYAVKVVQLKYRIRLNVKRLTVNKFFPRRIFLLQTDFLKWFFFF